MNFLTSSEPSSAAADVAPASAPASLPSSAPEFELDDLGDALDALEEQRFGLSDVFGIMAEQEKAERIVSVGAGGRVTSIRQAPESLWILDERALRMTAATSLYDVIRLIPGQRTLEISYGQTEQNMRFEGSFPENQTLVMVNGQSVLSDSLGIFDRSLINLRDVERVEVVFGPSSTRYGANAFSGVINIVTRTPQRSGHHARFAGDGGFTTGSSGSSGNDRHLFGAYANGFGEYSTGWRTGGIRFSVGGGYMPTFGLEYSGLRRPVGEPVTRAAGRIDVVQDLGAWQLRLQGDVAYKRAPYQSIGINDTTQFSFGTSAQLVREKLAGSDDRLTLVAGLRLSRLYIPDFLGYVAPVVLDSNNWMVDARADYALPTFARNEITVGAQLRVSLNDAEQLGPAGRQQYLAGVYVEDTFNPVTPLLLTAGVRLDTREGPGTRPFRYLSVSPRASVVWVINTDHTLRAEYSSAFRTPTAVERSATLVAGDGTVVVEGEPNLENERVHAGSLAWLGRFAWLNTRIELFAATTLNNIIPYNIAYQIGPDSPIDNYQGKPLYADPRFLQKIPYYYTNLPVVPIIPGGIVRLEVTPLRNFRAFASYSLLPGAPRMHWVTLSADWTPDRFEFSSQLYFLPQDFKSKVIDSAAHFIFNLRAAYWIDEPRRWQISLTGMNLIDVRFFYQRREGAVAYTREGGLGERLGPRVFATLEYRFAN